MSQVDTLIDEIGKSAGKLVSAPVAETAELVARLDMTLGRLRDECRELIVLNQLLRERLARSLEHIRYLVGPGIHIDGLLDSRGEMKNLDPRQ